MRQVIDFTPGESTPDLAALVAREARGSAPPERMNRLFAGALEVYERLATPRGMLAEITAPKFSAIYEGEGLNEDETPLEVIYPRAQRLALFAATVGDAVSEEIGLLFRRGEPATGYALDAIAAEAANLLADVLAQRFLASLRERREAGPNSRALPYSPGYCGWHVSGQRRLFEALQPSAIGIRLTNSFLMRPLKSVSGVLVAGPAEIHRFKPRYRFCEDCTTHECRQRMASVLKARR